MKNLRKVEHQELKNLGLSEPALNIYKNSDSEIFAENETGLYTIKECVGGLVSTGNTVEDLNDYYISFAEEE